MGMRIFFVHDQQGSPEERKRVLEEAGFTVELMTGSIELLIALKESVTKNPGHRELHNALGVLNEVLGNTKEALAAYEAELKLDPEDTDLRIRISELQGRLDSEAS